MTIQTQNKNKFLIYTGNEVMFIMPAYCKTVYDTKVLYGLRVYLDIEEIGIFDNLPLAYREIDRIKSFRGRNYVVSPPF